MRASLQPCAHLADSIASRTRRLRRRSSTCDTRKRRDALHAPQVGARIVELGGCRGGFGFEAGNAGAPLGVIELGEHVTLGDLVAHTDPQFRDHAGNARADFHLRADLRLHHADGDCGIDERLLANPHGGERSAASLRPSREKAPNASRAATTARAATRKRTLRIGDRRAWRPAFVQRSLAQLAGARL